MLKHMTLAIITLIVGSLTTGCAWLEENETSARVLTTYATLKVIDEDPEKARRVEEIALEVLQLADSDPQTTIQRLVGEARSHIRWERLDAADSLLVNALLIELEVRLQERYGDGIIPEDARLTVRTLAGWVIEAARTVPDQIARSWAETALPAPG